MPTYGPNIFMQSAGTATGDDRRSLADRSPLWTWLQSWLLQQEPPRTTPPSANQPGENGREAAAAGTSAAREAEATREARASAVRLQRAGIDPTWPSRGGTVDEQRRAIGEIGGVLERLHAEASTAPEQEQPAMWRAVAQVMGLQDDMLKRLAEIDPDAQQQLRESRAQAAANPIDVTNPNPGPNQGRVHTRIIVEPDGKVKYLDFSDTYQSPNNAATTAVQAESNRIRAAADAAAQDANSVPNRLAAYRLKLEEGDQDIARARLMLEGDKAKAVEANAILDRVQREQAEMHASARVFFKGMTDEDLASNANAINQNNIDSRLFDTIQGAINERNRNASNEDVSAHTVDARQMDNRIEAATRMALQDHQAYANALSKMVYAPESWWEAYQLGLKSIASNKLIPKGVFDKMAAAKFDPAAGQVPRNFMAQQMAGYLGQFGATEANPIPAMIQQNLRPREGPAPAPVMRGTRDPRLGMGESADILGLRLPRATPPVSANDEPVVDESGNPIEEPAVNENGGFTYGAANDVVGPQIPDGFEAPPSPFTDLLPQAEPDDPGTGASYHPYSDGFGVDEDVRTGVERLDATYAYAEHYQPDAVPALLAGMNAVLDGASARDAVANVVRPMAGLDWTLPDDEEEESDPWNNWQNELGSLGGFDSWEA